MEIRCDYSIGIDLAQGFVLKQLCLDATKPIGQKNSHEKERFDVSDDQPCQLPQYKRPAC